MNDEFVEKAVGVQQQFAQHLSKRVFLIQRCEACSLHVFPPREICPHCAEDKLYWTEPSGKGVVYSYTTIARKPEAGGDYNVSLIDLAEGVRMMSTVVGTPSTQVHVGMKVRSSFDEHNGTNRVIFLAESA